MRTGPARLAELAFKVGVLVLVLVEVVVLQVVVEVVVVVVVLVAMVLVIVGEGGAATMAALSAVVTLARCWSYTSRVCTRPAVWDGLLVDGGVVEVVEPERATRGGGKGLE
jgi:hypothetical protein